MPILLVNNIKLHVHIVSHLIRVSAEC